MQSLFSQTSLIHFKTPIFHASLKPKVSTTLTTKEKHYPSLTCHGIVANENPVAISTGTLPVSGLACDDDKYRKEGLDKGCMPRHVAIILDGTRRWSKANGKPTDYRWFFQANTLFADQCLKWGIGTATTYIYSHKNLERGHEANELIFRQLETYLNDNFENIKRKGIKLWIIGEKSSLPDYLQATVEKVEEATKNNTKLELMFALCYGGTREIVHATKTISEKVKNGLIDPEAIDENLMEKALWTGTSRAPNPDLLIRTGGRLRVSNYLTWQLAQTELYFCNTYAPDFKETEFVEALRSYQQRERTFGE